MSAESGAGCVHPRRSPGATCMSPDGFPGSGVSGSFLSHPATHAHASSASAKRRRFPHDSHTCLPAFDTLNEFAAWCWALFCLPEAGTRADARPGVRVGIVGPVRSYGPDDRPGKWLSSRADVSESCEAERSRTRILELTSTVCRRERGLMGLAFAPDYASRDGFMELPKGMEIRRRALRRSENPLVADAGRA